ncbi:MAG: Stf0 family sulfotransferase, partial [Rhodovibrionaceae bacterium]|nr:Stf0 family sulfotransferase [Rhodovibrionaceae bacterium]
MIENNVASAYQSYIICATPRTGSTLLCDLLESTAVAGRPDSYFRRQSIACWMRHLGIPALTDEREFNRAYLEAVLREGTAGTDLFGLRLMWETVAELSARLDLLHPGLPDDAARFEHAFGTTRYIHLSRQDKIAQAVSRLRAEQTGLWHTASDGSERERLAPPRPPAYDADRLMQLEAEISIQDAAWEAWFAQLGLAPIRV